MAEGVSVAVVEARNPIARRVLPKVQESIRVRPDALRDIEHAHERLVAGGQGIVRREAAQAIELLSDPCRREAQTAARAWAVDDGVGNQFIDCAPDRDAADVEVFRDLLLGWQVFLHREPRAPGALE